MRANARRLFNQRVIFVGLIDVLSLQHSESEEVSYSMVRTAATGQFLIIGLRLGGHQVGRLRNRRDRIALLDRHLSAAPLCAVIRPGRTYCYHVGAYIR